MENETLKGKAENVIGHAKEAAGNVTGNQELEAEGVEDQAKGHLHQTVGAIKQVGKDIVDGLHDGEAKAERP